MPILLRSLLAAALVTASAAGWGLAAHRLLVPRAGAGWAMRTAWGLAVLCAVGGVLASIGAARPAGLWALLALGPVAGAAAARRRRVPPADTVADAPEHWGAAARVAAYGGVAVALAFLLAWAVNPVEHTAAVFTFYDGDDQLGYFAHARRLLAGESHASPFDFRSVTSSLGAKPLLDALVLLVADERALHVLDPGVAVAVAAALVVGLARAARAPAAVAALAGLTVALTPAVGGNATASALGTMLLIALHRTALLADEEGGPAPGAWRGPALLVALVAAALCALKTTFVPAAAIYLAAHYALGALAAGRPGWRPVAGRALAVAAFTTVLLLPWMTAMWRAAGTGLYPLLGIGAAALPSYAAAAGAGRALGTVRPYIVEFRTSYVLTAAAVLVVALATRALDPRRPGTRAAAAMLIAAFGGGLAIAIASAGLQFARYATPVLVAALPVVLVHALARANGAPARLGGASVAALALTGLALGRTVPLLKELAVGARRAVMFAGTGLPTVPDSLRASVLAAQRAVPAGATILAYVPTPFAMDLRRNRVFTSDAPGWASPAPHMPLGHGTAAAVAYLRGQGVRFVAYGYRDNVHAMDCAPRCEHPWQDAAGRHFALAIASLDTLRARGRVVYDDGRVAVIDLAQPLR